MTNEHRIGKAVLSIFKQFFFLKTGAGNGGLGLMIEGPSEAKVVCKDNRDGSCAVEYIATEPGDYDVSIKFSEQHIPGSPFLVSFLFF